MAVTSAASNLDLKMLQKYVYNSFKMNNVTKKQIILYKKHGKSQNTYGASFIPSVTGSCLLSAVTF